MYQIEGIIQKIEIEGGFWGIIELDTHKKYLPDEEIPPEFKIHNLRVKVIFEPSVKVSIFQWGRMIHVHSITRLDEKR
ncbi:MAG: hypothetical protein NZ455_10485 [Bacteroidia bacterium]|nr:hypothetical protein [Bacteroidia bacterium]